VGEFVSLTAATRAKALMTTFHWADIGLFACVASHVLSERTLLIPAFTAHTAMERLLAGMNTHVDHQVRRPQEGLAAARPTACSLFQLTLGEFRRNFSQITEGEVRRRAVVSCVFRRRGSGG